MTTHLSDALLAELADSDEPHPHLTDCERCRLQVEGLRAAVGAARGVEVPEPSPLFWDHFAARVAASVRANQPARDRAGWFRQAAAYWRRAALLAGALVVIAVAGWRYGVLAPERPEVPAGVVASTGANGTSEAATDTTGDDETWALLTDAARELDLDTATGAGFDLQPGAAEVAAAQLSPDEQRELVRLLKAAVSGS